MLQIDYLASRGTLVAHDISGKVSDSKVGRYK